MTRETKTQEKAKRSRGTGSIYQVPRSRFWYMKYYRNGVPVVESTKQEDEKKALRVLNRAIAAVSSGDWLSPAERKITVAELWERLIEDYKMNERDNIKRVEAKWRLRLGPFFGHLRATQVTTDLLTSYIVKYQGEGLTNATLNRDMSALQRAFSLAYKCTPRKVQQMPVFPNRLTEAPPRKGFVEQADYERLAANAGSLWMRALLATAYAFGFRREELLEMRAAQIDLIDKTITLYRGETKNGEPRLVKMTQDVFLLLAECVRGKKSDDHVFTREGKPIVDTRDAWARMCIAAGLGRFVCSECGEPATREKDRWKCDACDRMLNKDRVRYEGRIFHDLRRSAVRNMIRAGVPERVAMAISGHKTRSVFDRYNIVSTNDLIEAARRIEEGQKSRTKSPVPEFGNSLVKVGPSYNA
jgi:integrase